VYIVGCLSKGAGSGSSALLLVDFTPSNRHLRAGRSSPKSGHQVSRKDVPTMPVTSAQDRLLVARSNVTPAWLLPFWRLVKTRARGDFAIAWRMLPDHLPADVKIPPMEVAAVVLIDHGLLR
jgi:hypothetical protein